jgi:small subunit ribosomal protein S17
MAESPANATTRAVNPRTKVRFGTVVSDKMQKTVVVAVESTKRHRLYNKTLKRTKRFKAHDENNDCRLGDRVRIVETRPLSKEKRWRVAEILIKGNVAEIQPRVIDAEILEPTRAAEEAAEGEEQSSESETAEESEA